MRSGLPFAAALSALFLMTAAPAWASYGALAQDQTSGKFGLSWNKQTQKEADEAAMKDCGESSCKIVFRTHSRQCGAIATAEKGNAWGAAYRGGRDAAALAAMNDCQKRTSGQCKVRAAGCNR